MDIVLILLIIIIPVMASFYIKYNYSKYSEIEIGKKITGFDVARMILDKNGLTDVHVLETPGELSDHYDPKRKVVKLSKGIYSGTSVASIAVAAHECGHAIQDKEGYLFLKIRHALVPIANITSNIGYIFIVLGFILEYFDLFFLGIGLSSFGILFQLVTLPVEYNASSRAKELLNEYNVTDEREADGVKVMLNSAALTYVASLVALMIQLLRYVLLFSGKRD